MLAPENKEDGSIEIISEGLKYTLPMIDALNRNSFLLTNTLANGHVARPNPMFAPPVSSRSYITICLGFDFTILFKYNKQKLGFKKKSLTTLDDSYSSSK
ncbi:MAG: hypothetical protein P0Y49_21775 [Candidatus Pedobacter colombiensis]|uniref:Uncharacterized protein n=1 Tax=Candidatus Pedobacter colombiensis TaxID=3121371 RepID=A0AAJ5WAV1_9SPHI|nr:hypothetical protein [Pedobacter sp.]WEK19407.1 MAG: hypothetical protein P0Y49_21775 [Pedobacter sp.]